MQSQRPTYITTTSKGSLKVLFVSHSFPPDGDETSNLGGMQRVAVDLFEALSKRELVEVIPFVLKTSWEDTNKNAIPFFAKLAWNLPKIVKENQINIVVFSSMVTASILALRGRSLKRLRVPSVAIAHGQDVTLPNKYYQKLLRKVFSQLDMVAPVSSATADECYKRGADYVRVVPNGIAINRFDESTIDEEWLPQAKNDLILLSVGRHVKRKGFQWFVEEVMTQTPEGVQYWLIGDGPETQNIHEAVGKFGLPGIVKILGKVSEETLAAAYQKADLFIMPNIPVEGDMEGFGVVMIEANLMSTPVLAADLEGIRDVVAEKQNGFLLPSGDEQAFLDHIVDFKEHPRKLSSLKKKSKAYVEETFSWESVAEQFEKALRSI